MGNGEVITMDNHLHPKVLAFKEFINKHPDLLRELRTSGHSWQYFYNRWELNGVDDPLWKSYSEKNEQKTESNETKILEHLLNLTQKMDFDKVQKQIHQWDKTIDSVQKLIQQFSHKQAHQQQPPSNQIHWFRD